MIISLHAIIVRTFHFTDTITIQNDGQTDVGDDHDGPEGKHRAASDNIA